MDFIVPQYCFRPLLLMFDVTVEGKYIEQST
jgi:hypothetical protein